MPLLSLAYQLLLPSTRVMLVYLVVLAVLVAVWHLVRD